MRHEHTNAGTRGSLPSSGLRSGARVYLSEIGAALAAALAVALLLALAGARAWPLTVDVGGRDARFVTAFPDEAGGGFHAPETIGDTVFRWTSGAATLDLPRPPAGDAALTLRLLNGYPDGQPDPRLELSVDGRPLASLDITRQGGGIRRYQILAPAAARLGWALPVELRSTTYTPPNDRRPLGVVVDWARLEPLRGAALPPPGLALSAMALGALGYALARGAGATRIPALGASLALGALVAGAAALRPLEVLPFAHRIAALLGVGLLGITLARLLAPPATDQGRPAVRGQLSIRGADLPIYMAAAWWVMPLFQVAQTLDGAEIGLGSETLWIGGGLGLALLAAVAVARVRGAAGGDAMRPYVLGTLALGALVHLGYMLAYAFTRNGKDFWILFRGAREWVRGGSLYDIEAVLTNHMGAVFKVPPFYGMLFTPFVFQDGLQILHYHRLINVALIALTALVILLAFRPRPIWWGVALLAIVLNGRPLADTVAFGQIDLLLLFLLSCALWAMRGAAGREARGSEPIPTPRASSLLDLLAGALVALGTLFKIYPVILLAFFTLKRRWWALAGFALGMLVFNGVAVAVMGWEMHRVYLLEVLPRIGGTTSWVENQTISGFLARTVDVPFDAHIFQNRPVALAGTLISGLVSLLACALALLPARPTSTTFALQYGMFLLLMVLAVPAAWMHYETLLVLPFATLALHLRERQVGLGRAALLATSFALVMYGNQWSFNGTTVMGVLTIAGVSYKFYGMLLLGGVTAATLIEDALPLRLPWRVRLAPGGLRAASGMSSQDHAR